VVPSPVGSQQANPPIVAGVAQPAASQRPETPQTQPVATPAPATPNPTAAPLQPVATPTPTPPPLILPASPLPAEPVPTEKPGVPAPPPVTWRAYDPAKIPTKAAFNALHFVSEKRGYLAASDGSVVMYDKTGTEEPALQFRKPQDNVDNLYQVFFTADDVGYVAGATGTVYRTKNAGVAWEKISPTQRTATTIKSLVVYNDQIAVVADESGTVFRTENLNATLPADVTWTTMPTRPFDRPADAPAVILAGAGSRDTSVAFFVGDGIFKLDADAADGKLWTRVLDLDDLGTGTSIEMPSQNEIWVGTSVGNLIRSMDGGATWTTLPFNRYLNREYNGNALYLSAPGPIAAMSVLNSNNAFLAGAIRVFDTKDAGVSWREFMPLAFSDLQIRNVVRDGKGDFQGFAVGASGAFYSYTSSGLR
jgi:photosystem II stability/assembly factor-like uncharacterized protein